MTFEEDLVSRQPALMGQAMNLLRNVTAAEDAVQDTLCSALTNRDKFKPGTNFGAWLSTILRNSVYGRIRRANRVEFTDDPNYADHLVAPGNPHETLVAKQAMEIVEGLNEKKRQTVIGAIMGLTVAEMAAKFAIPDNTVKSRTLRGREEVFAKLAGA